MGNKLYIVDYDIPVSPAKRRVMFYRDLKKLVDFQKVEYSTLSVFRTKKEELAKAVFYWLWLTVGMLTCIRQRKFWFNSMEHYV